MNRETVQNVVETAPRGANIVLEWERKAKLYKGVTAEVRKHVRMVGRVGIDYNHIGVVQGKRENGELPPQEQPIWNGAGEWVEFPFLIRHTVTGELYVRLYNGTSDLINPKVAWTIDGNPASYDEVEPMLVASERSNEKGDCFTVKLRDVLRIGRDIDYTAVPVNAPERVSEPVPQT